MRHVISALTVALVGTSHAAVAAPIGQPFCTSPASLHAYLLALSNHDVERLSRIEGCILLQGGLDIEIIVKGTAIGGMHVDQVRISGADGSSIGWTLDFD